MSESLKLAIADDEPPLLQDLEETLIRMGHQVVVTARNGGELIDGCSRAEVDLVITDIKMPDMNGLEAASQLRRTKPVPIVIVSAYHDPEFIERASQEYVMAYLVKPVNDDNLMTNIQVAMRRFREFQSLLKETDDLKRALEERKIIERAKGVLIKRGGLSESDAFQRLQELASGKHLKMVEVARSILTAEQALRAPS